MTRKSEIEQLSELDPKEKDTAINPLSRFRPETVKEMDSLALMLMSRWPASHLPEFYQIFGKEALIKFLDIFAGMTIKVPSRADLEDMVKKHSMYNDWKKTNAPIAELARIYDLPLRTTYYILNAMDEKYKMNKISEFVVDSVPADLALLKELEERNG